MSKNSRRKKRNPQVRKTFKHNRQGSKHTTRRYEQSADRIADFSSRVFHLQNLNNLSGKHLAAYTCFMEDMEWTPSSIKTELSGIRFFHDKLSDPKYSLPSNKELGLELMRRSFGGQDRTWSDAEFHRALAIAQAEGHDDYITAFYLARFAGLRIHECFRIDSAIAERALRERAITIKGKGGKVRTVPIEDERIPMMLKKMLAKTVRGHKLLVPDSVPTDKAIHALQVFILKHREEILDEGDTRSLTFHGNRHNYAVSKYNTLVASGKSDLDAQYEVSRLLGHERADVTRIYLASIKEGSADGE